MTGFVYILKDDLDKYYIGSAENVDVRFKRHIGGWVHTTRRMKNPKIVLRQKYPTMQIAKKIEIRLKKLKRRDYIENIIKDGVIRLKL